jgi:tetratricopeptide (TPR) repeat protein
MTDPGNCIPVARYTVLIFLCVLAVVSGYLLGRRPAELIEEQPVSIEFTDQDSAELLSEMADLLARHQRPEDAAMIMRKAVLCSAPPEQASRKMTYIRLLNAIGKTTEANRIRSSLTEHSAEQPAIVRLELAQQMLAKGETKSSTEMLESILSEQVDHNLQIAAARTLGHHLPPTQRRVLIREQAVLWETSKTPRNNYNMLKALMVEEPDLRLALFVRGHRQWPEDRQITLDLTRAHLERQNWEQAQALLDDLLATYPSLRPAITDDLARIAAGQQRTQRALNMLREGLEQVPDGYEKNKQLAEACLKMKLYNAAEDYARNLLAQKQDELTRRTDRLLLARALAGQGKITEACELTQSMLGENPTPETSKTIQHWQRLWGCQ